MATTSACAVGSLSLVTRFWPGASSAPPGTPPSTTTAPNGPPPSATLRTARSMAAANHCASDTSAPSNISHPLPGHRRTRGRRRWNPTGRAGANGNGDVNALVARCSRVSRGGAPVAPGRGGRGRGPGPQQVAVLPRRAPAQVGAGGTGDAHGGAGLRGPEEGPGLPGGRRGGQVGGPGADQAGLQRLPRAAVAGSGHHVDQCGDQRRVVG